MNIGSLLKGMNWIYGKYRQIIMSNQKSKLQNDTYHDTTYENWKNTKQYWSLFVDTHENESRAGKIHVIEGSGEGEDNRDEFTIGKFSFIKKWFKASYKIFTTVISWWQIYGFIVLTDLPCIFKDFSKSNKAQLPPSNVNWHVNLASEMASAKGKYIR